MDIPHPPLTVQLQEGAGGDSCFRSSEIKLDVRFNLANQKTPHSTVISIHEKPPSNFADFGRKTDSLFLTSWLKVVFINNASIASAWIAEHLDNFILHHSTHVWVIVVG